MLIGAYKGLKEVKEGLIACKMVIVGCYICEFSAYAKPYPYPLFIVSAYDIRSYLLLDNTITGIMESIVLKSAYILLYVVCRQTFAYLTFVML